MSQINEKYPEDLLEFHEGWVDFYKSFGISVDLTDFCLPKNLILEEGKKYGSIITPEGFNPPKALQVRRQITDVKEKIHVYRIKDVLPRVKVVVISLEQNVKVLHSNISLSKSLELEMSGTTFTEGILFGARMIKDFGINLDVGCWTRHSGSRYNESETVYSGFIDGRFCIDSCWPNSSFSESSIRTKQF